MLRTAAVFLLCSACLFGMASPLLAEEAPHADHEFVPPIESKSLLDASLNPIPREVVEGYLERVTSVQTFRVFEGQNAVLAGEAKSAEAEGKPLVVARGFAVEVDERTFWGAPSTDGAYQVWQSAVVYVV